MAGGRPKKAYKYNIELVNDLASIFCTVDEIANIMGVSKRTLERDDEFCRIYKENIDNAKQSLRRAQLKSALSGNTTMLLWLGKQYLGQREPLNDSFIPEEEQEEKMEKYAK